MDKKVILWDFDGTLIRACNSFGDALQSALAEYDFHVSEREVNQWLDRTCSWKRTEETYCNRVGCGWGEELFLRLHPLFLEWGISQAVIQPVNRLFREKVISYDYEVYEDAVETLERTKEKGYRNYILSNNHPELHQVVQRLPIAECMDGCFASGSIGYEKPRIELYEYVQKQLNDSQLCYMVGDNPHSDIPGAKKMGMTAILVHREISGEADCACERLLDILEYLDG